MAKRRKTPQGMNLKVKNCVPLTANQERIFDSSNHMVLYGVAGTGKTYISCYQAFKDIEDGYYDNLVIIRSAVSTRDIGFLPGTDKEKAAVYEMPYRDIANDLFERGDAYENLKTGGLVHFMTTSFIRGTTLKNSVIIIDECQNMSFHELDSIITRMGENCRVIFCGDFKQSDLKINGLEDFLKILKKMELFDMIEFGIDDIVRSGFVKEYIIARTLLNL